MSTTPSGRRRLTLVACASLAAAFGAGGCGLLLDTDPPDPMWGPDGNVGPLDLGTPDFGTTDGSAEDLGAPPADGGVVDVDSPDGGSARCRVDDDCDDGRFCMGVRTCVDGMCREGVAVSCPERDGVACTVPVCDPDLDACVEVPDDGACPEGDYCHPTDGCQMRPGCVEDGDCMPPSPCLVGKCDAGRCLFPPRDCIAEDPDPTDCLVPYCDGDSGECRTRPNHGSCDDGIDCTVDRCTSSGRCENTPDDGRCDDMASCTRDICDPHGECAIGSGGTSGCRYEPVHSECASWLSDVLSGPLSAFADGLACSRAECVGPSAGNRHGCALTLGCPSGQVCLSGSCHNVPMLMYCTPGRSTCSDGNPCNGEETCGLAGTCTPAMEDVCGSSPTMSSTGGHCVIERRSGAFVARCVRPVPACGLTGTPSMPMPPASGGP